MYDPTPAVEALMRTAPESLRAADPDGLERYVVRYLLRQHERRPYLWNDFVSERPDLERIRPLVYDRPSGLVFVGGLAEHERLSAELLHLRTLDARAAGWLEAEHCKLLTNYAEAADCFIILGVGMRVGSPSAQMGRRSLLIGSGVIMTEAELRVFADYRLVRV